MLFRKNMQTCLLSEICFSHVPAHLPNPVFRDLQLFAATLLVKMRKLWALF